jgi:acetoin utilization protein AcuB
MALERAVSGLMSRRPLCVRSGTLVREALAVAREHGIEHLLVTESDNIVGLVCTCDLARARSDARVTSCMKSPVVTIDGAATLRRAAEEMHSRRVGSLPVTAGNLLVGIVTRTDLKRAGVPEDLFLSPCISCGSTHHLSPRGETVSFCMDCLECGRRNGVELGTVD